MPFLPREGLTLEAAFTPFRLTVLEPFFSGPLLAGLLYFPEKIQKFLHKNLQSHVTSKVLLLLLKVLVGYGIVRKANNFLSHMVLNNWTRDPWRHGQEIVLVTGAGGGIGEAVARGLAASSAPSNVHFHKLDVTSTAEIKTVSQTITKAYGAPSIIINNAGTSNGRPIFNQTDDQLLRIFNVNLLAHFRIIKEFLPPIANTNHGHVVSVASMNSYAAISRNVDYCCTKAATLTFHHGLAQELKYIYGAPKVKTTIVNPGYVKTPMLQEFLENEEWMAKGHFLVEPETVADAIIDQLHSGMGGQLIVPGRYAIATTAAAWPAWLQESLRNMMAHEKAFGGNKGQRKNEPDNEAWGRLH